jgi:hypothetical protein
MGDLDIAGTRKLAEEIYGSFTKFGTKSFLLWNRVAGYCIPHNVQDDRMLDSTASPSTTTTTRTTTAALPTGSRTAANLDHPASKSKSSLLMEKQQATETDMKNFLTNETGMDVISAIPCYCDIQFSRKEFLTVLEHPEHPFTKQFERLIQAVEAI